MNAAVIRKALRRDHLSQPVLGYVQIGLIFVGSCFWIMVRTHDDVFHASVYGELATRLPAEVWALTMMCASALVWVGLRHPIKRWMVIVGAAMQLLQFTALGYSALYSGGEAVIGVFCNGFFGPLFAYLLVEAFRDP